MALLYQIPKHSSRKPIRLPNDGEALVLSSLYLAYKYAQLSHDDCWKSLKEQWLIYLTALEQRNVSVPACYQMVEGLERNSAYTLEPSRITHKQFNAN